MIVLGHDPSLASYGLALVDTDGPTLLSYGVVTTSQRDARSVRLRDLYLGVRIRIERWLDRWAIDGAAFEAGFAFAGRGRGSDLAIAEARGVGMLASSDLDCVCYAPSTIRLAVCGNGRADKLEAGSAVMRIFGSPLPADVADAAAVALTAGGYAVPRKTTKRHETTRSGSGARCPVPAPRKARRNKAG